MRRSVRRCCVLGLLLMLSVTATARAQSAIGTPPRGTFISIDDPAAGQPPVSPVQGVSWSLFGAAPFPGGPTGPGAHVGSTLVTKPVDSMSLRVANAADDGGVLATVLLVNYEAVRTVSGGVVLRPLTQYCLIDAHIFGVQTGDSTETITLNPANLAAQQFAWDQKTQGLLTVDTWRLEGPGGFPSSCGGVSSPTGKFSAPAGLPPILSSQTSTGPKKSKACRRAEARLRHARARVNAAKRKFKHRPTAKNRRSLTAARHALTAANRARRHAC